MNKEKFLNTVKVIALATVLAIGVQYAAAQSTTSWEPPKNDPPEGNAYAPINDGPIGQVKSAGLTLGADPNTPSTQASLIVPYGRAVIGNPGANSNPPSRLYVYGPAQQDVVIQSTGSGGGTATARLTFQTADPNGKWHIESWVNSFRLVESGQAARLTIWPGGQVEVGKIKITEGASAGKVLTSDANGVATWQVNSASPVVKSRIISPATYSVSAPYPQVCGLIGGREYLVTVYGVTTGAGNDDQYTVSATFNNSTTVSIYISNHPDGTAPVSLPVVVPAGSPGGCINLTNIQNFGVSGFTVIG